MKVIMTTPIILKQNGVVKLVASMKVTNIAEVMIKKVGMKKTKEVTNLLRKGSETQVAILKQKKEANIAGRSPIQNDKEKVVPQVTMRIIIRRNQKAEGDRARRVTIRNINPNQTGKRKRKRQNQNRKKNIVVIENLKMSDRNLNMSDQNLNISLKVSQANMNMRKNPSRKLSQTIKQIDILKKNQNRNTKLLNQTRMTATQVDQSLILREVTKRKRRTRSPRKKNHLNIIQVKRKKVERKTKTRNLETKIKKNRLILSLVKKKNLDLAAAVTTVLLKEINRKRKLERAKIKKLNQKIEKES